MEQNSEKICNMKMNTEKTGGIVVMSDDIRNIRPKSVVTDQDYKNRLNSGHKSIFILQRRLDIAIKKFCFILSENEELREDINHLLNGRSHFNFVWKNLLKDINVEERVITEWIERATMAYDQREDWCSKLVALRKRTQNDFFGHSEEMRDIQRKLDNDLTLREFLSVKGQIRILKDLEDKERKKKENQVQNVENQLIIYISTMEQIQV
ncbi:unnamed protein product [Phaedon cochleariae]|uniref:ODAD1 central coiled coil region domain-containing protein n=1 Tax=Phaedon cochleariae TaxID=80249 RepID=A0A9N9X3I4_PHACE|nr:unnamed protein product [Phaedon cochleariae]